jgi:hypothetical protein
MRKTIGLGIILTTASWAISCAPSVNVNFDYDRQADFAAFKTYDWLPLPKAAIGNAQAALALNPLLDKRIKTIVGEALSGKGVSQTSNNPDLWFVYHTSLQDKVDVTTWGYAYGPYWRGYGPGRVDVYAYKKGTLVLDVIDARKKELVWRGIAEKTLEEGLTTEEREQNLKKAISKLLAHFPPK